MTAPILPAAVMQLAPVASLGMYDLPWVRSANDALWAAIARRLVAEGLDAPAVLTRDTALATVWRDPSLLLAQTCGYPLTTQLRGAVQVVATPRYTAAGCTGAFHRSAIVVGAHSGVRKLEALRGARCAVNEATSNSGMNLLRAQLAPLAREGRFFGEVTVTGSHLASLAAVGAGHADAAAIDAVTLGLVARHDPELAAAVRVIGWTQICPGLPLITAAATPAAGVAALRRTLDAVAADPQLARVRETLLLDGFTVLPSGLYDQIPHLEQAAARRGYPVLA